VSDAELTKLRITSKTFIDWNAFDFQ